MGSQKRKFYITTAIRRRNTKKYSFIVAYLSYTHQDSDVVLCPIQGLFLPCLLPDYARIIIHVDDTSLPRQIGNEKC